MPVNLSVKNVPDVLAERLRRRAEQAHRSLQGELMVILEEAVYGKEPLTPVEALEEIQRLGLKTGETATQTIRSDRDAR
jgi:plasmid stability protein